MIHSILPIQSTCLAIFLHKLSPHPLWSTSWSGALRFIFHKKRKTRGYDYTRITTVIKRCGFYAIRRARPDYSFRPPPSPRVRPLRCWQQVAWCHSFSFAHVPTHIVPTVVTHVERATHDSWPRPSKTSRHNHRSGHHSSTVLTAYVYVTLRSTRSWSKMVNVIFRPYGRKFKHIYRLFSVRTDGNLQLN